MRLISIETQGFRREDLSLELEPVTVVIGENEAGKSQVPDAVRLLLEGAPPESILLKQEKTASGVMRYARDPREGIRIVGRFDDGSTAIRTWQSKANGTVAQTIEQDLKRDVVGLREQSALLLGLLPEASLWDVRSLLNQDAKETRRVLLRLFGGGLAMDACPEDAPEWALPAGKEEPASEWVLRVMARAAVRAKDAAAELKQAKRDFEDAQAEFTGAVKGPDPKVLARARKAVELTTKRQNLLNTREALRATLEARPAEVAADDIDAALHALASAQASMDSLLALERKHTTARIEGTATVGALLRDLRALPVRKVAPKPGCPNCGHGALPAREEGPSEADRAAWAREKEAADAVVRTAVEAEAKARRDLEPAKVALREATQALADLRLRASVAKAFRSAVFEAELLDAELAELPALDAEQARQELADLEREEAAAERGRVMRALVKERGAEVRRAEEEADKAKRELARWTEVQTRVLAETTGRIAKPLSKALGREVEIDLFDRLNNPDLRWRIDGVDAAAGSDSQALALLVALKLAMAPLSDAPLKILSVDRFEAVSASRRAAFVQRLADAVSAGVISQALVTGCPDSMPAVSAGVKVVRR